MAKPKLTQHMTLHINGGSKSSELHYEIKADGKHTGITAHTMTNGSPKYKILAKEMHFGTDTFDFLKEKGAKEWIILRIGKDPPT